MTCYSLRITMNTKRIVLLIGGIVIVSAVVLSIVLLTLNNDDIDVVVSTPSGAIRGVKLESDVSTFYAFFGVRYAKPPVKELRFKAPVPIVSWKDTYDGTYERPRCIQSSPLAISEDCLILNIYTKEINAVLKPVLVFVHGGALEHGSSSMASYGPDYLIKHDIIVVTIQFRLGMLGFLNLNLEDAPGNMGLADIIEALSWTKNNIASFGGDPNQVTLAGQSSGGIMTHALLLSPRALGLFQKVIIQSGTALSYRFYHEYAEESIQKTKQALQMADASNEEILAYLQSLDTSDIMLQISRSIKDLYPTGYAQYYPYAITRDLIGILPENPMTIIQNNTYQNLPMLIGINSDEGIRLETFMDVLDFVNEHFYIVVPTDLHPIDDMSNEKNETASLIKEFYFGDQDLSSETFHNYAKLCTDSWYGHITDYLIRLQGYMNYSSSYYYYMFAVDGAYNKKIYDNISTPGASHSDELGYIWKMNDFADVTASDDYSDLTRERVVAMWSNFIKTGNPTPETNTIISLAWEPVDYPSIKYLLINKTLSMEEEPLRERLLFWQQLYGLMTL